MSDYVEFTPDGLVVHKWNIKKHKFVQKKPKKMTVITHLRSRCDISEGTTLGQIFNAVDKYELLKMVISQYSWCRQLESFHAQAKEKRHVEKKEQEVEYLELYHHPEVYKTSETKKHPGGTREKTIVVDFNTSIGFHGIGTDSNGESVNYAVSYSPMWELVDLPVKLNKKFDVYEPMDVRNFKKQEKLLTATREFTLLDVLDAIYWDISFMGGPENNAEFIGQMSERIDQIENGNIPMIPIEQVFTGLRGEECEP